jgi:hypothetical protein
MNKDGTSIDICVPGHYSGTPEGCTMFRGQLEFFNILKGRGEGCFRKHLQPARILVSRSVGETLSSLSPAPSYGRSGIIGGRSLSTGHFGDLLEISVGGGL